jgi:hypothetical protein
MYHDIPGEPDLEDQRGKQQEPQTDKAKPIHTGRAAVIPIEHET